MNILMIGTGYVGLTTGVCFAQIGHDVTCIEIDQEKITKLRSSIVPFFEPELAELMQAHITAGQLRFDTNASTYVDSVDLIFLAVQTPQDKDGKADLTYIKTAAQQIAESLRAKHATNHPVIVTKSTVPVGTARLIKKIISDAFDQPFEIASNPEFLREGSAVQDFLKPDRIVMGTESVRAHDLLEQLYAPIEAPKLHTTIESSEMIKYASNAFLATKISFINEIANVCENTGADVKSVAEGMGMDKRIGKSFLQAGIGYGGSCFPKDVRALHSIALKNGYDFLLLKAVVDVNNNQRNIFVHKIRKHFKDSLQGKKIAVLGLAFKKNTDDTRESAAIDIIRELISLGAHIRAYDPVAIENAKKILRENESCSYFRDIYTACDGADALVITTEWEEFSTLDMKKILDLLASPVVFDGKNLLDKEELTSHGFTYVGMGR